MDVHKLKYIAAKVAKLSIAVLCTMTAMAVSAQTFKTLVIFNGNNGEDFFATLVQSSDHNLYGTTVYGGLANKGTIFRMTQNGKLTTIYNFCNKTGCSDGANPEWLTLAADGNFYGVTYTGGTKNYGSIFKVSSTGTLTTIYNFCSRTNCTDGAMPQTGLVQLVGGNFYGTTTLGGKNGQGTVFKVSSSGKLTTLYNFCSQSGCTDGAQPYVGLVQAKNGAFYGTTVFGGTSTACRTGCGTVFRISPKGKFQSLHSFCGQSNCPDGSIPQGRLIQAKDGNLYGTTDSGGGNNQGTVFRVTEVGKVTTLHSFCVTDCSDGALPYAGLLQASNGDLYGTTALAGPIGFGTIFKMTTSGNLTTIHGFNDKDGFSPVGELMQASNGSLYGGTEEGGNLNCYAPNGCGVIFRLGNISEAGYSHSVAADTEGMVRKYGTRTRPTLPASILERH